MACHLYKKSLDGLDSGSIEALKSQAIELAHITLLEITFIYYKSSVVAASCLAAARIKCGLQSVWPVELEELTRYSYNDIHECLQALTRVAQIPTIESFVSVSQDDVWTIYCEDPRIVDCKWKLKTYNCARTKRRYLIQPRDLKKMYCAV